MKKVLVVFGTRPEAIKMAPLVLKLKSYANVIETRVCVTAQHRQMLDHVLDIFEIIPDYDLDIMRTDQGLHDITERIIAGMKKVLADYRPNIVCVHGDTTTAFAAALSSFYCKISVAHVEAGLRAGNIYSPWPEEANRKLITAIANLHFAPTQTSKNNLLAENVTEAEIYVTGNTVIDALFIVLKRLLNKKEHRQKIQKKILSCYKAFSEEKKYILITGHRRENFGDGFIRICKAIRDLSFCYPDVDFVYPVHLNPNVQKPVFELLSGLNNVHLIEPLEYEAFTYLMSHSYLVLTDSGGIQEEAPSLGKPVLVMRDTTERPEAIDSNTVKLVGTTRERIVTEVSALLDDPVSYNKMSHSINPYGDGTASLQISKIVLTYLGVLNLTAFNKTEAIISPLIQSDK